MKNKKQKTIFLLLAMITGMGVATAQQQTMIRKVEADSIAKKHRVESGRQLELKQGELKSKEVSQELAMPKNGEIYIENAYRTIQVKTWDQQKVKVITTAFFYENDEKATDEELFEKSNVSLRVLGSSVKIKSGIGNSALSYSGAAFSTYNVEGYSTLSSALASTGSPTSINIRSRNQPKRSLTIFMPAGSKLDIESKYADVQLPDNITDLNLDISNGNLEAGNLSKLILRSKYTNVNIGNIKNAEVELINGRFTAQTVDDLDIDTKNATVELVSVKKIMLRSSNDEYDLEEVGVLSGRKNYGNLRITRLNSQLELEGSNADIKIRNVSAGVNFIKVDNKYADIRIPLRDAKNYSIDFTGAYSSVYGNFEKKPVVIEKEKTASQDGSTPPSKLTAVTVTGYYSGGNDTPARFTASVGDGKGIKVDMKCQNCTVDFK